MGDTQVSRGICAGAVSGICLGAEGWDDGDRSRDQGQGGGYISREGGLKRYITISDRVYLRL